MRVVFFGSSSFVVPILDNIYFCRNLSLLQVIREKLDSGLTLDLHSNNDLLEVCSELEILSQDPDFLNCDLGKLLNSEIELVGVVTQADTLHRGKLQQSEVAKFANENHIKLFQPEKIKAELESWNSFIESSLDLAIVSSYGQILSQSILDTADLAFLNWHPSKLPLYRGPSPMQQTLLDGSIATALSWIKMEKGMDSGDVYLQIPAEIKPDQNFTQLANEMGNIGSQTWPFALLIFLLHKLQLSLEGNSANINLRISNLQRLLPKIVQNNVEATFTKMLTRETATVDITNLSSKEIYQHFLAYIQYPKTSFYSQYFNCYLRLDLVSGWMESGSDTFNPIKINEEWYRLDNKSNFLLLRCKNKTYLKVQQITLEGGRKINLMGFQF